MTEIDHGRFDTSSNQPPIRRIQPGEKSFGIVSDASIGPTDKEVAAAAPHIPGTPREPQPIAARGHISAESIRNNGLRVATEQDAKIFDFVWGGGIGYVPEGLNANIIHEVLANFVTTHAEIPSVSQIRQDTMLWGVKTEYIQACLQQIIMNEPVEQDDQIRVDLRAAALGGHLIESLYRAEQIMVESEAEARYVEQEVLEADREIEADPRRDRVLSAVVRWLDKESGGRIRASLLVQRMEQGFSLPSDTVRNYLRVACSQKILFKKSINGTVYYLNHQLAELPKPAPIQAAHEHRGEICDESEVANAILDLLGHPNTSIITGYTPKQLQTELYRDYIGPGRHATVGRVKDVMRVLVGKGLMNIKERGAYGRMSAGSGELTAGLASSEVRMQLQEDPDFRDEILALFDNPEAK